MALLQDNQFLKLTTPLGQNVLVAQSLEGRESISEPFYFAVRALSEEDAIDDTKIVGKSVSVSIKGEDGQNRFFNGYCVRFVVGHKVDHKYREYGLEIVPWLSLLKYRADCRIFQEMTPVDIIQHVFIQAGFTDFELKLQSSYDPRTYCVQYRETDFNFVSRLMEEEGIFYYFKHSEATHTLVLCDYAKAYDKVPKSSLDVTAGSHGDYSISTWERKFAFCSGKVSHTDYNFTTPSSSLMTEQRTILSIPNLSSYEVYDYPGEYGVKSLGDDYARTKMEAIEAEFTEIGASSDYPCLCAGFIFKTGSNQNPQDAKKSFVVKTIVHQASEGGYRSNSEAFSYSNQFTCVPDDVVLRSLQKTPKPFIRGTQTAVVVGPSGEEIFTDEYGRIKVQFFWDRLGTRNENSSCWIRVAQIWAGKKWGAQFIPRIGQEVLVSFLEGDPDRPLIIGSVYNAEMMPTYELPAKKTQSGIKSRSTKTGSPDNFNEIRFEDDKGNELFYLHAEKDEKEVVENDQRVEIGHNQSISVGNDQDITVGHNSTESIGNDLTQSVGHNTSLTTGNDHSNAVARNMSLSVGNNRDTAIGNDQSISVGNNKTESIGKNSTLDVGVDLNETVGGSHVENVSKDFAVSAKTIQLSAKDSITIKVGKAQITMKKNGDISISGGKINVKGSGKVVVKGSQIAEN